jgi:hypothetical protein
MEANVGQRLCVYPEARRNIPLTDALACLILEGCGGRLRTGLIGYMSSLYPASSTCRDRQEALGRAGSELGFQARFAGCRGG